MLYSGHDEKRERPLMAKQTIYTCDYNSNLKPHPADFTVSGREGAASASASLGIDFDACGRHLGSMLLDKFSVESLTMVAVTKVNKAFKKPIAVEGGKSVSWAARQARAAANAAIQPNAEGTFDCPECDRKGFNNKGTLGRHRTSAHPELIPPLTV